MKIILVRVDRCRMNEVFNYDAAAVKSKYYGKNISLCRMRRLYNIMYTRKMEMLQQNYLS